MKLNHHLSVKTTGMSVTRETQKVYGTRSVVPVRRGTPEEDSVVRTLVVVNPTVE